LDYLNEGLTKPKRMKKYDKVLEKVGSLKSSYSSIETVKEPAQFPLKNLYFTLTNNFSLLKR
jgi:hypothetical protein